MELYGRLRFSESDKLPKTASKFGQFNRENADVFRRYFGVALYPGSLNVDVAEPSSLQLDLDEGRPRPTIVIPRHELVAMPSDIGDGQAWPCALQCITMSFPLACWVFRRIGSRTSWATASIALEHRSTEESNTGLAYAETFASRYARSLASAH